MVNCDTTTSVGDRLCRFVISGTQHRKYRRMSVKDPLLSEGKLDRERARHETSLQRNIDMRLDLCTLDPSKVVIPYNLLWPYLLLLLAVLHVA